MNILDSLGAKNPEDEERKDRRPRKVKALGDSKKRKNKQKTTQSSLLNATTFIIITKFFAFLLSLFLIIAVGFMIYMGIEVFLGDNR